MYGRSGLCLVQSLLENTCSTKVPSMEKVLFFMPRKPIALYFRLQLIPQCLLFQTCNNSTHVIISSTHRFFLLLISLLNLPHPILGGFPVHVFCPTVCVSSLQLELLSLLPSTFKTSVLWTWTSRNGIWNCQQNNNFVTVQSAVIVKANDRDPRKRQDIKLRKRWESKRDTCVIWREEHCV
jgi:hypothetical protein